MLIAMMGMAVGAPQFPPDDVALVGRFGRVMVSVARPALTELRLRRADGSLEPQQLLSPRGAAWLRDAPTWGTEAYSYVADAAGRRYESRLRPAGSLRRGPGWLRLGGIQLAAAPGEEPVAEESWTIRIVGERLEWTVERRWLRPFTVRLSGSPAIYMSNRPIASNPSTILPNSTAFTLWVDPARLRSRHEPLYRGPQFTDGYKMARDNAVWVDGPDPWAVAKLWTSWPARRDLRAAVRGGSLYRRGFFAWIGELGADAGGPAPRAVRAGQAERLTLTLSPVEASASGHQLTVSIPDKTVEETVRRYYGSLFNGGCVNDPVRYAFGNEVDGWYYAGATWMKGLAMLAGAPASGRLAGAPISLPDAFRQNIDNILGTAGSDHRTRYGYNITGTYVDDNLHTIIGAAAYLLYSGDVGFIRHELPAMEGLIEPFIGRVNRDGLYDGGDPQHWYYDAQPSSGVNTYHNCFLVRALRDMAGMERAAGRPAPAARYAALADRTAAAINARLWCEDAPGGPRYVDWVRPDGEKVTYAADLCQWPPLALGIATPEQGRKLIATLDRRIAVLERENAYAGRGSSSAYWPVPPHINTHPANQGFGSYMNGGSFLAQTYWEIVGRARYGDGDGAWRRLRLFSEGAAQDRYCGNNWVMMNGAIGFGACDEPYLSDMIVVPAALVHGILGIRPDWDRLTVDPALPTGWPGASAEVVWKGARWSVRIANGRATTRRMGPVTAPPSELTWGIGAGETTAAAIYVERTFETASGGRPSPAIDVIPGRGVALALRRPTHALAGLWRFEPGAATDDSSAHRRPGAIDGQPPAVGLPGPREGLRAARFEGAGEIRVGGLEGLHFAPTESFTIQAWFRTGSRANQVLAARSGAWSLGVRDGRLSMWVMADGVRFVEANGRTDVADGKWRHAALVVDRARQTIAGFLDGQPDTGEPQSIAAIGASTSSAPMTLGAFGGSYHLTGDLAAVSVRRGALEPSRLSWSAPDQPAPPAPPARRFAQGEWVSEVCDWGAPAELRSLLVDAAPGRGSIEAILETWSPGCQASPHRQRFRIADGPHRLPLLTQPGRPQYARVRLLLSAGRSGDPLVRAIRLTAEPAPNRAATR